MNNNLAVFDSIQEDRISDLSARFIVVPNGVKHATAFPGRPGTFPQLAAPHAFAVAYLFLNMPYAAHLEHTRIDPSLIHGTIEGTLHDWSQRSQKRLLVWAHAARLSVTGCDERARDRVGNIRRLLLGFLQCLEIASFK